MRRSRKPSPHCAQLDEVFVNLFTKVPMAILRVFMSPSLFLAFGVWLFGVFMFYFATGFFLSYIPAKIYQAIGVPLP